MNSNRREKIRQDFVEQIDADAITRQIVGEEEHMRMPPSRQEVRQTFGAVQADIAWLFDHIVALDAFMIYLQEKFNVTTAELTEWKTKKQKEFVDAEAKKVAGDQPVQASATDAPKIQLTDGD